MGWCFAHMPDWVNCCFMRLNGHPVRSPHASKEKVARRNIHVMAQERWVAAAAITCLEWRRGRLVRYAKHSER